MTERLSIAIQYVNYKTKNYLRDSIDDVLHDIQNSNLDYKIYIIDNASGDKLSEFESDTVTVTYSDKNLGFGTGHNSLLALHDRDYTLLLNPDTRLIKPNTIERLVRSLEETLGAVAVGPCLVDKARILQKWDHGELDPSAGQHSLGSYWEPRTTKAEVAWVSGAACLLKTSAFKAIGGFDEQFFLYKEEEDLFLRLRQNGQTTYYDPSVRILHIGSVVAGKDNPYFEESIAYYNQKHGL